WCRCRARRPCRRTSCTSSLSSSLRTVTMVTNTPHRSGHPLPKNPALWGVLGYAVAEGPVEGFVFCDGDEDVAGVGAGVLVGEVGDLFVEGLLLGRGAARSHGDGDEDDVVVAVDAEVAVVVAEQAPGPVVAV